MAVVLSPVDRQFLWTGLDARVALQAPVPARLTGIVVDDESGEPLAGLGIRQNEQFARSDAEGRVEFVVSPGNGLGLEVDEPGWRGWANAGTLYSEETVEVTVRVSEEPRVRGRVTRGGRDAVAGRVLALGNFRAGRDHQWGRFSGALTDPEGYYSLVPDRSRERILVPKNPATPELGAFRRFGAEFLQPTQDPWPWSLEAPARGEAVLDVDLP